ncbi:MULTISPECIES: penicillin-binding protein activator [Rhodomicrobium]|uniref:penicillin-binding protein activator n=1 Tax=Rhodomicrobium TaxID=1068 RepID=UPI000B4AB09A|nr:MULTISPECIES: penicillin-binding protein activator [Rhodomicrobium]
MLAHSFHGSTRFGLALKSAAALVFGALFLAGCSIGGGRSLIGGGGDDAAGTGTTKVTAGPAKTAVKVAFLLPMSSPNSAKVAQALKQAGELALFDFDNPNVELVPKDTRGTPEGAKAAAESAVKEGAELIIGPLFANEVSAAAPIAQRANIPMIAFSSDRKVAGNGVYLLSFLAGSDVPRIVSYAVTQGKTRFAALIPQTEYGRLVEQSFLGSVKQLGGQIVAVKSYPQDANGMLAPVREIAELAKKGQPAQFDVLFIPAGQDSLPALAPLLPYSEVDTTQIKVVGTAGWDYTGVGKEQALVSGWFSAPDPKGWTDFTKRYVETYGDVPPRLSTLAYDAVSLAISLSNNPAGSRFGTATLTRSSGFAGVDGLFRLRPDGTSERGFAVLEVQRFGNQVIDAAPAGFTAAQY